MNATYLLNYGRLTLSSNPYLINSGVNFLTFVFELDHMASLDHRIR